MQMPSPAGFGKFELLISLSGLFVGTIFVVFGIISIASSARMSSNLSHLNPSADFAAGYSCEARGIVRSWYSYCHYVESVSQSNGDKPIGCDPALYKQTKASKDRCQCNCVEVQYALFVPTDDDRFTTRLTIGESTAICGAPLPPNGCQMPIDGDLQIVDGLLERHEPQEYSSTAALGVGGYIEDTGDSACGSGVALLQDTSRISALQHQPTWLPKRTYPCWKPVMTELKASDMQASDHFRRPGDKQFDYTSDITPRQLYRCANPPCWKLFDPQQELNLSGANSVYGYLVGIFVILIGICSCSCVYLFFFFSRKALRQTQRDGYTEL
eukprot:CAMPEP_0119322236 /NCGR_PEP_ID=MMETSP1333-20130426/57598_1 /TAXON_ID=418940 /ORGANISM="Scyphosphaera apsteinii, Strain RCC1455" /LENGTH=326 /DNA_ID=CAMNT_0007329407 /DNA_START=70 /DNA_END=1050 /DNA_ORIENTATION=+